jgi:hypothetical protein
LNHTWFLLEAAPGLSTCAAGGGGSAAAFASSPPAGAWTASATGCSGCAGASSAFASVAGAGCSCEASSAVELPNRLLQPSAPSEPTIIATATKTPR